MTSAPAAERAERRNGDALRRLADFLAEHPDNYEQTAWATVVDPDYWVRITRADEAPDKALCRTRGCIAGWAVLTNKQVKVVEVPGWRGEVDYEFRYANGRPLELDNDAPRLARKILGLTDYEAHWLFASTWRPPEGMSVPRALRLLADGATLNAVTDPWKRDTCHWHAIEMGGTP